MRSNDLIKKITNLGAILERRDSKHDWHVKKETNVEQAAPRHTEIKEFTACRIIKFLLSFLQSSAINWDDAEDKHLYAAANCRQNV